MKCYLLPALGWLSVSTALAQRPAASDYVVTTAGDTLRGHLSVSGKNSDYVTLRQAIGSRRRFGPADIRSYGRPAGLLGVSRAVGPQRTLRFVQPLVQGPIQLYRGRSAGHDKPFYLQSPDTTYLVKIVPARAQLIFVQLLPGCSGLQFGTDAVQLRYPLTYSGLTRLVTDYNACVYPQEPSRVLQASRVRVGYGLKMGANYSGFALGPTPYPTPARERTGYQAGVFVRASTASALSLQLEALYTQLQGVYQARTSSSTRDVRIDYTQVQLPALLRYTVGSGAVRPFLTAGLVAGLNLRNRSTDTATSIYGPSSAESINTVGSMGFGGTAGLGTTLQVEGLPEMSVEARYDWMRYGNYAYFTPRHSSLRLDFSVLLRR